jgi:hypothetical protein
MTLLARLERRFNKKTLTIRMLNFQSLNKLRTRTLRMSRLNFMMRLTLSITWKILREMIKKIKDLKSLCKLISKL